MSNPLDATPMQLREELAIVWSIVEQEKEFSSRLKKALAEREKQVTILRGYCEAQLRKDKAASYERCPDCDYEQKCSLETGCLGVKDNSPIMNKALAATEPK